MSERRADREFTAKQKTELVLAVLKAVVGLRRNGRVQGFLERDRVRRWSKRWTGRDQASAGQPARRGPGTIAGSRAASGWTADRWKRWGDWPGPQLKVVD